MQRLSKRTQALRRSPWWTAVLLSAPLSTAWALGDPGEPRHFFEAGLGPGFYQISDDVVRGLRWQGPSLELDAGFRYASETDRHDAFLRFGAAYLQNRYDHAAVSAFHHLGYGFTRRVLRAGCWGTLFLGGQVREDVDLEYYIDWDEEHAYWLSSYALAAAARYEVSVASRHGFDVTLALPLLGWVGRPPEFHYYKADNLKDLGWIFEKPFEGLVFATLDKYQAAHLAAAYTFHPGRGWSLRLAYLVDYRRASFPRPAQVLVSNLTAGFVYAY
jgi:hypothetical protein